MRKHLAILVAVFMTANLWAQSPEKMSYQAVVRNTSDALVKNTEIGMRISLLKGSATGTAVYVETQKPTTNANGLVSVSIGEGTVVNGAFASIDWPNGPYFIKTETDISGGISYSITGTSQLLSVPYALHAKTAESVVGGITESDPAFSAWGKDYADLINKPTTITTVQADAITANTAKNTYPTADATKLSGIEEGAEVNIQADWNQATITADDYIKNKPTIPTAADGSETKVTAGTNVTVTGSGTTASPYVVNATGGGSGSHYLGEEYLGGIVFYLYTDNTGTQKGLIVSKTESAGTWSGSTLVNANKTSNGAYNMALMPTGAGAARTWVETLGAGWYLPSIDELSFLWHNRFHVNNSTASGLTFLSNSAYYWSSTEYSATGAFYFYFYTGYTYYDNKAIAFSVRAVRAF